jgi:uncharacterized protein YcnI
MYIIGFENEADYKKYSEMVKNDLTYGSTFSSMDIYEGVAKQEAKNAMSMKLADVPELYYDESFNKKELEENIESAVYENGLLDKIYQVASDEFEKQVKEILAERQDGV